MQIWSWNNLRMLCFFFIIIIISEGCGNSTLSSCGPLKAIADCILSHLSLHGKTTNKENIVWGRKFKGETLVTFSALKWTQLQMQWGFNILSDRKMLNKHPPKKLNRGLQSVSKQRNSSTGEAGLGSLKHSADLWHTFAPNKQMYG